jgi:hypothetical protein
MTEPVSRLSNLLLRFALSFEGSALLDKFAGTGCRDRNFDENRVLALSQ